MPTSPFPLVTIDNHDSIQAALQQLGIWVDSETIERVERAGEGNMNLVLRVVTNRRRLILKQSRPWVEKYPDIAAPADRILAEIDFYNRIQDHPDIQRSMPKLLAAAEQWNVLAMEDLGQSTDYTDLYASDNESDMPLDAALLWLARLHSINLDDSDRERIGNRSLRELNHAHIFVIPLQNPSAIPLDDVCPGLEAVAQRVRSDTDIESVAKRLGQCYLGSGPHLLHGDFYPGSWLRTEDGFRVIDPEFTFAGPAEFDLAVLAAHRFLIGKDDDSIDRVVHSYRQNGGPEIDETLLRGFAGMEIIRRLIGVAQLPLSCDIDRREAWIETAIGLLSR